GVRHHPLQPVAGGVPVLVDRAVPVPGGGAGVVAEEGGRGGEGDDAVRAAAVVLAHARILCPRNAAIRITGPRARAARKTAGIRENFPGGRRARSGRARGRRHSSFSSLGLYCATICCCT